MVVLSVDETFSFVTDITEISDLLNFTFKDLIDEVGEIFGIGSAFV